MSVGDSIKSTAGNVTFNDLFNDTGAVIAVNQIDGRAAAVQVFSSGQMSNGMTFVAIESAKAKDDGIKIGLFTQQLFGFQQCIAGRAGCLPRSGIGFSNNAGLCGIYGG